MTERYTPAVGHMVRQSGWGDADTLEVTAVGRFKFLTLTLDGIQEQSWNLAGEWVQVVQPKPLTETWAGVAARGGTYSFMGATSAATAAVGCRQAWGTSPLAIVHIWTDADGVDHAEIERFAS
jgi:hypothetical protein